jgi:hypothetical protein
MRAFWPGRQEVRGQKSGWENQNKRAGGHYKKISKIPIFGVGVYADLIDLNRFGEVVYRRAGIIRLIDLALEDGPVDTLLADKKENLMWREVFG